MDWLVIDNYLFDKQKQPQWNDSENWRETYEMD
jgi:carbamoyltransferase